MCGGWLAGPRPHAHLPPPSSYFIYPAAYTNAQPTPYPDPPRHRGKFICLGVTLTLGAIAGIAAAILWPKMPVFTLLNETVLTVDPLATGTGNSAKLVVQIQNPNKFASTSCGVG